MQSINKILVCLEEDQEQQTALERAIYLSQIYQAEIELLLVVHNRGLVGTMFFNPAQQEAAKSSYINSHVKWVEKYQRQLKSLEIKASYSIIWHKPLYEGVLLHAKKINADLIIKNTHLHPVFERILFTPNDWQLLKSSKIPLILTKSESSSKPINNYKNVLAAIDPAHTHSKPDMLDDLIVHSAFDMGKQLASTVHVAHCYSPIEFQLWSDIGLGMGMGMGPTDFMLGEENYQEYIKQLKDNQEESFRAVTKKYPIAETQLHLVEGYPESKLPELVEELKIDLLVLGTTFRTGLVGSTAEKVLEKVNCDVLSVQLSD